MNIRQYTNIPEQPRTGAASIPEAFPALCRFPGKILAEIAWKTTRWTNTAFGNQNAVVRVVSESGQGRIQGLSWEPVEGSLGAVSRRASRL